MPIFLIIIFVLIVAGMVYFVMKLRTDKVQANDYLEKMAHFFEGQLLPIPDSDNSHRITFKYRGYDCFYEDVNLPGLFKGSSLNVAYLKVKAQSQLSLNFTERSRTQIRSTAQTLDDVSNARWGNTQSAVDLPKSLQDFHVYTSDPEKATKFINNPKALRIFETYKNRDARGHPLMSLQIVDGVVVLEFHATGGLKPSHLELQYNVTAAEAYLQELIVVAEVLQNLNLENPHQ